MKGNGVFVRSDGPVQTPQDLEGRLIATHQGAHAIHRYLLRRVYGVDDNTLRWESHRQEKLLERVAERQGRCRGVARSVFLSRRGSRGRALPLHRRRGLAKASRLRSDDQAHGRGAGRSAAAAIRASKTCCSQPFADPSLTVKRTSKKSATCLSRVTAGTGGAAGFGALSEDRVYFHRGGTKTRGGGDGDARRSGRDPASGAACVLCLRSDVRVLPKMVQGGRNGRRLMRQLGKAAVFVLLLLSISSCTLTAHRYD